MFKKFNNTNSNADQRSEVDQNVTSFKLICRVFLNLYC